MIEKFDRGHILDDPYVPVRCNYWAKMPFWTIVEFGCVTTGFEPVPLQQAPDDSVMGDKQNFEIVSDRVRLGRRAVESGTLAEQIDPFEAINWLLDIQEPFPEEFQDLCKRRRKMIDLEQAEDPAETLRNILAGVMRVEGHVTGATHSSTSGQTKVISTLQKLLLSFANKYHHFDPTDPKSGIPGAIASEVLRIGLKVDETTVRRHLDDAADKHWKGF